MKIISTLFISLVLISCGNKKKTKELTQEQQRIINQIQNPESPPKDFRSIFQDELKANSTQSKLVFKKEVKDGETLHLKLRQILKESAKFEKREKKLNYCKTQLSPYYGNSTGRCSSFDLIRELIKKKIPLQAGYSENLESFSRVENFFLGWKKNESALYPEELYIQAQLNGEKIDVDEILEGESNNGVDWIYRFEEKGLFELKFSPPQQDSTIQTGHLSPKLYPCKLSSLPVYKKVSAWVTSLSHLNSKGFCPKDSFFLFSENITSKSIPRSKISGLIEVLSDV